MVSPSNDKFSAAEQGLGYIYQLRYALYKSFDLPEDTRLYIERDDDLDTTDAGGDKKLLSLKHKADGDRLTDLSTDFWKSIRIWLQRYNRDGKILSNLHFCLITTAVVAEDSPLEHLASGRPLPASIVQDIDQVLAKSRAVLLTQVRAEYDKLTVDEKADFLARITIFDKSPRIDRLPERIMGERLRTIRREFRQDVFERLEGWWTEQAIQLMTGVRQEPLASGEVSDKLAAIADEYKSDRLPITFSEKKPQEEIDADEDSRLFVRQLREIGASSKQIQWAILDYYRAFEQRSEWARKNLLVSGEMERYEDRLVEEWDRYRETVCLGLEKDAAEAILVKEGKKIYNWAQSDVLSFRT